MIAVDIRADLNAEDQTGYVWAFLDEARDPSLIMQERWSSPETRTHLRSQSLWILLSTPTVRSCIWTCCPAPLTVTWRWRRPKGLLTLRLPLMCRQNLEALGE
jgi:hypothetical protein